MSDLPLIIDSPHVLWTRAVADIPQEIHEAAETVSRYFRNEGMDEWTFGPIASRSYLERVEVESAEWCNKALQYSAEREHNAMEALAYKAERDELNLGWKNKWNAAVEIAAMAQVERDALLEALRAISVADWKTAGELRCMARIAVKGGTK